MKLFSSKNNNESPRRRSTRDETAPRQLDSQQFVRNRTIGTTGYKAVAEESERGRVHQLTAHRRRVGGVLLVVLGAIVFLGFLLLQLTTQVAIIGQNAQMSRSIDSKLYIAAINDYFDHHPIERLRFMLNNDQLGAHVGELYPEVSSVKQRTSWGVGKSEYELVLRRPIAGWVINDKQYFVDAEGVAFENNYYDDPTVQILDESGAQPVSGATVTSTRFLGFIGRVVALGEERGYIVTEAKLPLGTTRQADIRIKGVKSVVKLSIDRGAGEQMEDLDRALRYLSSRGIEPAYIDLRISGRAYYR